ncbi:MAG: hypothetical protein JRH20_00465 [Deltaproteobacteria bacterium]|nr:hypothetical protein [Deltaproteobacteria bacterium]
MTRDLSKTRPESSLDDLFASVAGIVRIAARRYFLRWMRREVHPPSLPVVAGPITDTEQTAIGRESPRCPEKDRVRS